MRVLIDQQPVDVQVSEGQLLGGLVEQVQALAGERQRVVANMTVDGQPVPIERLEEWLTRPCEPIGQVDFETACPRGLARQAIAAVSVLFAESTAMQQGASEKLAGGQTGKAMEQLAGCLGLYKSAQEAISKAMRLARLDLDAIKVGDTPMAQAIAALNSQLGEVKSALEARDLVLLADLLAYEFPKITERWLAMLAELDRLLA